MPAERFVLSQSWWLAGEIVRRHPGITLVETHPGGGTYDCLTLMRDHATLIDINRAGSIHVGGEGRPAGMSFESLFDHENPAEIIALVEQGAGLRSAGSAPVTTPTALAFRVAAQVLALTVNDKRRWDVRSERVDSSGMDGGGRRWFVDRFPIAAERARQRRPDDLLGDPYYRYWGVTSNGEAVAVLDTDGFAYVGEQALHLPSLYQAHNRRLTPTVAAAFAAVLP
ncbi:hypothetical protein ACQP2F_13470 [Actinoplanes sp. CA-030573]|uniref:TY-Chap2 family putative peptide chaperone n=1 Tax=Actinoplanes sp. CA-030573 TaxID=3239898 RepID=UPI003D91911A